MEINFKHNRGKDIYRKHNLMKVSQQLIQHFFNLTFGEDQTITIENAEREEIFITSIHTNTSYTSEHTFIKVSLLDSFLQRSSISTKALVSNPPKHSHRHIHGESVILSYFFLLLFVLATARKIGFWLNISVWFKVLLCIKVWSLFCIHFSPCFFSPCFI